jgi:hypothetical protein
MTTSDLPSGLTSEVTYGEVGQNYRKFLDWREKIIGGYVAVIGGLGFGYDRTTGTPGFRFALLVGALLTSLVFWILNMRNSKFIVTCVRAGQKLEVGKGVYSEMGGLTHTSRLTHGLAVNMLVSGVIAGSAFGLWITRESWLQAKYVCPAAACLIGFVLLAITAEVLGNPDAASSTRKTP